MSEPTTRGDFDDTVRAAPGQNGHSGNDARAGRAPDEATQRGQPAEERAARLSDLVRLHLDRGEFATAEPLLLQLLELKAAGGEERAEVATILASLATVRYALGRHDSAEQLWWRVLRIRERLLAPNHFVIARSIEHLADACAAQGKLADAVALLRRAIAMYEMSAAGNPATAAMRAKVADLQLLASQEATEPRAMRALNLGRWADHDWRAAPATPEARLASDIERDTVAAQRTGANGAPDAPALESASPLRDREPGDPDALAGHTLLLVPDGSDADAERQPSGGASGSRGAHLLQQWRPSLGPLRGLARDRRKQTAIGGIALALVAIGVVALAQRGNAKQYAAAAGASSRASAPDAQGEAGGALAHPAAASFARTPDTTGMAPTDPRDQASGRRGDADSQKTTANDARVGAPQLPPMQNIRLPATLGAAESSIDRSMDSSLHAIAGSALTQVRGEHDHAPAFAFPQPSSQGQAGGAAEGPLPAGSKPAVLAAGSPMPSYPPSLKPEGVDGEVVVEFVVDTTGHADASTLEVISSDNQLFTTAVRKALPRMRFVPAESAGHKIQVHLQMPFRFTAGGR